MTSVNSPACLLARNHFYRNAGLAESMKPGFSLSHCPPPPPPRQRHVTVWLAMTTAPGFPGGVTRGWVVSVDLGSTPPCPAPFKRPSPANRTVK